MTGSFWRSGSLASDVVLMMLKIYSQGCRCRRKRRLAAHNSHFVAARSEVQRSPLKKEELEKCSSGAVKHLGTPRVVEQGEELNRSVLDRVPNPTPTIEGVGH
ncbi:hypothetical protein TIFTF001_029219 [Ficus carica]|uniref:Uncharacterized protein n=1 Tax=Ficus carica TaxID=3494 RepID=A0AA88DRJ1_FICCA|nr:hypothetical protein TIFTF001_029219 [Ficus carica]